MSAQKVDSVLAQKVNEFDSKSKATEKSFIKRDMTIRDFTEKYMEDRKQYHKYQLLRAVSRR